MSVQAATVGADRSIRVWSLATGQQKYEFLSPDDAPLCISYRASVNASSSSNDSSSGGSSGEQRHLACGFESGCLRVLDVPATRTLVEYRQHNGSVSQVCIYKLHNIAYYTLQERSSSRAAASELALHVFRCDLCIHRH
jgi:WD repeat-containing protein 90